MVVFVEASVLEDPALARDLRFQDVRDKLQTFRDGTDDLQVRFIIIKIIVEMTNQSIKINLLSFNRANAQLCN